MAAMSEAMQAADAASRRRERVGILCASRPAAGDLPLILAAAQAALAEGAEVEIFAMDDGVLLLAEPDFLALLAGGAEVAVCAMDAEAHGVDLATAELRGVTLGDQSDHARILRRCDRFLSFT